MLKETQDLKNAVDRKGTSGKGFGNSSTAKQPQSPNVSEFQPNAGVSEAQAQINEIARVAKDSLRSQLATKVSGLRQIEDMLDNAAEAIAQREQNIVSGVTLESMLAEKRQQYLAEDAVDQAAITVEFEALQDEFQAMTITPKRSFPPVGDLLKRITPAQKARLDQAVLGPAE